MTPSQSALTVDEKELGQTIAGQMQIKLPIQGAIILQQKRPEDVSILRANYTTLRLILLQSF